MGTMVARTVSWLSRGVGEVQQRGLSGGRPAGWEQGQAGFRGEEQAPAEPDPVSSVATGASRVAIVQATVGAATWYSRSGRVASPSGAMATTEQIRATGGG